MGDTESAIETTMGPIKRIPPLSAETVNSASASPRQEVLATSAPLAGAKTLPATISFKYFILHMILIFSVRMFAAWGPFAYFPMTGQLTEVYSNMPLTGWIIVCQSIGMFVGTGPSLYLLKFEFGHGKIMAPAIMVACGLWMIVLPTAVFPSAVVPLQLVFIALGMLPYTYFVGIVLSYAEGRTNSESYGAMFLNGGRTGAMVGFGISYLFFENTHINVLLIPLVMALISILPLFVSMYFLVTLPSLSQECVADRTARERGSPEEKRFLHHFWFHLSVIMIGVAVSKAWIVYRVIYYFLICDSFYTDGVVPYSYSFFMTIGNVLIIALFGRMYRGIKDHKKAFHMASTWCCISYIILTVINGCYFGGLNGFAWLSVSEVFVGITEISLYTLLERLIAGVKSHVSMVRFYMLGELLASVLIIIMVVVVTTQHDYYDTFFAGTSTGAFGVLALIFILFWSMYWPKRRALDGYE